MKQYQPEPLNRQASVLVDCQTDIKITIKNGVLSGAPFFVIEKQTKKLIDRALNKISSPTLKEDARVSLTRFARRAYEDLKRTFPSAKKAVAIYVLHRHGKYIGCRYGKKNSRHCRERRVRG